MTLPSLIVHAPTVAGKPRRSRDFAHLLLREMPAALELELYEIDEWSSAGAIAQIHRLTVKVAPGRLGDLLALVARLEAQGAAIGHSVILEAEVEDLGGGYAIVSAFMTD